MKRLLARILVPVVALVAIVAAATVVAVPATAATGNQGYAVYRDGVFINLTWHGAFLDDPHWNTTSIPVIQQPGYGYVQWGSWSAFLDGKTYKGTYRPNVAPSSASRDNFQYMARKLKDEQIGYTVLFHANYDVYANLGTWLDPSEVSNMRCDGVIEYVYEWYGFRVFGNNQRWDVTRADIANRDQHSGTFVSPQSQAESYLTRVTTALP